MHNLFNIKTPITGGITRHSKWMYLKPNLKRNVDAIINYYRNSSYAVKSQHFLIRLLLSLTTPKSQEIERYYSNVDSTCLNIAMTLGMTSSISKGSLFKGIFYGQNNKEILIADNSEFDPIEADNNWEELEPIRVIRHPRSDLTFNIPNGINTGIEDGICVIIINIPMLAIQYRAFRNKENKNAFSTGANERSIMQFIHMYPLTNMVRSHADVAIFNRASKLFTGEPLGVSKLKHSFYLIDYSDQLDEFLIDTLCSLEETTKNLNDTLRSIPVITKKDLTELFTLPDVAVTRQLLWAYTIACLPALVFLFKTAKYGIETKNGSELNMIRRKLIQQKSENLMKTMLSSDISLLMDIESEIDILM